MDTETFRAAVQALGVTLTDQQLAQFAHFYELLIDWNQRMNLTAITDKAEVYLKHFYDSLTIIPELRSLNEAHTLLDVGGGAGFPSIPLKIAMPDLQITVLDSLKKRMTFLDTVIEELGLTGITTVHGRAEIVGRDKHYREQFDVVTARAVARMTVLSEYCLPFVKLNGTFIAMKGSKGESELVQADKALQVLGGQTLHDRTFELPGEEGARHIITVQKTKATPKKYPRKAGTPNKQAIGETEN